MDLELLAEKVGVVRRHLDRVAEKLPSDGALTPMSDASDAIILHLWQAVQVVIDVAVSLCVAQGLGSPSSYADAFARLRDAGLLEAGLASRLSKAAGFRNLVAHAYGSLDLARVVAAARTGPNDLLAFLVVVRDLLRSESSQS